MPFTISPGVVTKEIDLTTVVPEISMTEGAIAGPFKWGPAYDRITVTNETELVDIFGKPNAATYKTFFTAASYLAYSGSLKVVRTPNITDTKNATMDAANTVYIANDEAYENTYDPDMGGSQSDDFGDFVAKYTGDLGNSLRVSMCQATHANTNADGTLPIVTTTQYKLSLTNLEEDVITVTVPTEIFTDLAGNDGPPAAQVESDRQYSFTYDNTDPQGTITRVYADTDPITTYSEDDYVNGDNGSAVDVVVEYNWDDINWDARTRPARYHSLYFLGILGIF